MRPPINAGHVAVKEAVLPFNRLPEVDTALGPEMRSTGEVMGIDTTFGRAFYKAEIASGNVLPSSGTVFVSLADRDKPAGLVVVKRLRELKFSIAATKGTAEYLAGFGFAVDAVLGKVGDQPATGREPEPGALPNAVQMIASGQISFVINTPQGQGGGARSDGEQIRKAANVHRISSVTTVEAALAAVHGMAEQNGQLVSVRSLQSYHAAT